MSCLSAVIASETGSLGLISVLWFAPLESNLGVSKFLAVQVFKCIFSILGVFIFHKAKSAF
jgi:hypothetical protein